MRSFILIPTLALINMGANAATIGGAINRQTGGQLEVANRQLHNADFSSTTPDGSTPAPALGDSTGPSSATSPSAARRRVADLPAGVPPPVADALGKATDATMTTSTSKRDGNIAFGSLESQEDAMLANINKLYDPTVSVDKFSVSRSDVDLHKHARKATLARFANVSVSGNQGEAAPSRRASDINDVVNAADVFGPRDVVSTAGNTIAGVSPVSAPSPPSSLKAPRAFEGSAPAEDNSSESDAPAPPAAPAAVAGALGQAKTIVGGVGGASVPEYRRFILSPPKSGVHTADKRHEEIEEIEDHDLDLTDSVLKGAYARRGVGIKYGTVSGALNTRRSVNIDDDGLFSAAASKRGVDADAGTGLASAVISSKRAVNVDGVPKANIRLMSASAAFNRRDLDVDFKPANPSKPVVNVAAGRLPAEAQKRQIGVNAAFSPAGTPGAPASNRDVEVDSGVVPVGAVTAERRDLDLEDVTAPAGPLPNLPVAPPSGL